MTEYDLYIVTMHQIRYSVFKIIPEVIPPDPALCCDPGGQKGLLPLGAMDLRYATGYSRASISKNSRERIVDRYLN